VTSEQLEWHRRKCEKYQADYPRYKLYAGVLEQILMAACRTRAPLAIVKARAKGFASFAEKMARKAEKYMKLAIEPTDLCGARVITETQAEVNRVCEAIRSCKGFAIDEENSVDVSSRLTLAEFGYLSVHYAVQLRGREVFGVAVPIEIIDLKAEIQVRTLLQHAWASITHDRLYKSAIRAPDRISRDLHRVAALLEEADEQFGAAVRELDEYLQYGAYMDKRRLQDESGIFETVLEQEPVAGNRPVAALRLAAVYRSAGDWEAVRKTLENFIGVEGDNQAAVLAEHGHAVCRLYRGDSRGPDFRKGRDELEESLTKAGNDLRPRALAYRAWASSQLPENEEESRVRYQKALEADPKNPFHLAAYVENEMYCGEKAQLRSALKPVLEQAIQTCRAYADAGIESALAFFTMGRFHLLLDQPYEALAAYAKGTHMSVTDRETVPDWVLDAELTFLRHINRGVTPPEEHAWAMQVLLLAKHVRGSTATGGYVAKRSAFSQPVVVLAGGTNAESAATIEGFRAVLERAFVGFKGTVISGGTDAGVAGLAGAIANSLGAKKGGDVEVLGYIPSRLPWDQSVDRRYSDFIPSDGSGYGAVHPLQYWTDLLAAGVRPADVRILGIDGGRIAALEYRLALALGAEVALLEPTTRAAARFLKDRDWCSAETLIALPKDGMTVCAFVNPPRSALSEEEIDKAARRIHENYLEEKRHENPDKAMQLFDKLTPDLQDSNRAQAQRAAGFLERVGYRVQRASGAAPLPVLTRDEIDRMAEMEHGRWVVERLESGWRYGRNRDPEKKQSPFLVPWTELTEEQRDWDRNAGREWPRILAEAGLEIVRNDDVAALKERPS
jgi:ppGpp synthetase/RelA/SpoT-type nucleotidyltranferase